MQFEKASWWPTLALGKGASLWHGISQWSVRHTLAQSYLHASGHSVAGATELAISRKEAKYSCLPQSFLFVPVVLETLEQWLLALDFFTEVGRQLSAATGDASETALLFQLISVTIQRFNAVLKSCHTRCRAGPLAIPVCVFSFCF